MYKIIYQLVLFYMTQFQLSCYSQRCRIRVCWQAVQFVFLEFSLSLLRKCMVMFSKLLHDKNASRARVLLENKSSGKLIFAIANKFAVEFEILVLSTLSMIKF